MTSTDPAFELENLSRAVRIDVFERAAASGHVPSGVRVDSDWYKNKLRPDWKRHALEETEARLAAVGLTGRFWNLG